MSKPGGTLPPGSARESLRLPERHPACRRREAQPGSCTERENLDGDAKGKGTSGSNREAESTDAPARGGLLRSSEEAGVMPVERREQAIAIGSGQPAMGGTRYSMEGGSLHAVARAGTRECQVRICEKLGVKFPGPTRQRTNPLARERAAREGGPAAASDRPWLAQR